MDGSGFVNKLLFPAPACSYTLTFPFLQGHLIWIPNGGYPENDNNNNNNSTTTGGEPHDQKIPAVCIIQPR